MKFVGTTWSEAIVCKTCHGEIRTRWWMRVKKWNQMVEAFSVEHDHETQ